MNETWSVLIITSGSSTVLRVGMQRRYRLIRRQSSQERIRDQQGLAKSYHNMGELYGKAS